MSIPGPSVFAIVMQHDIITSVKWPSSQMYHNNFPTNYDKIENNCLYVTNPEKNIQQQSWSKTGKNWEENSQILSLSV